tara:strand:+ start:244 stop:1476 length:1233 start_codon:yes stop_codon:yes gene_type:complete
MKNKLSEKSRLYGRKISPVREIMMYANHSFLKEFGIKIDDFISFAGGWVSHPSPIELEEAYREVIHGKFHECGAYSGTTGDDNFKNAIIKFNDYLYGGELSSLTKDQICVGLGSTQLFGDLLDVLLNPDDTVLLLDPTYCNYPTQIEMKFPTVKIDRYSVLVPETWEYKADPKDFARYIRATAPKAIILVSPDNPTSQVLSDDFVNKALAAAQEVGSFIIMDFAYKELVFDQKYPDYYSWAPNDNFISLRSNSKWCRGLGRRLGWIEAPDFVVKAMETMQSSSILCPDMLHQLAFTTYINNIDSASLNKYVKNIASGYKLAGDMTVKSIRDCLNYPVLTPKGGLYVCVDVKEPGPQFVERVLKETGVLFVPGWGFGNSMKNAVRVSYGPLYQNYERINEGFMRVKEALRE